MTFLEHSLAALDRVETIMSQPKKTTALLIPNIPMDRYVMDAFDAPPSLNSSLAHLLLTRSPAHVWQAHPRLNPEWAPADEGRFDLGSAAHALLLEKNAEAIAFCDFPDWRSKPAQAAREAARAAGKIPILIEYAHPLTSMGQRATHKIDDCPDLQGIGPLLPETTGLWQHGDAWLRCRPDWMTEDRTVIISYKTAGNAEPEAFTRGPLLAHSYDLQAMFELEAVRAVTGIDAKYFWLVGEVKPPFACSLIGLSPEWYEFAHTKFRKAVAVWTACLESGTWPAYSEHIYTMDLPPWVQPNWMERHGYEPPPIDDGRPMSEQLFGEEAP